MCVCVCVCTHARTTHIHVVERNDGNQHIRFPDQDSNPEPPKPSKCVVQCTVNGLSRVISCTLLLTVSVSAERKPPNIQPLGESFSRCWVNTWRRDVWYGIYWSFGGKPVSLLREVARWFETSVKFCHVMWPRIPARFRWTVDEARWKSRVFVATPYSWCTKTIQCWHNLPALDPCTVFPEKSVFPRSGATPACGTEWLSASVAVLWKCVGISAGADWSQAMLAIIRCRIFCLPVCYPEI